MEEKVEYGIQGKAPHKNRPYEVEPGVSTKDLKLAVALRCPRWLRRKLKWQSVKRQCSMNVLVFRLLADTANSEGWEDAPEFVKSNPAISVGRSREYEIIDGITTKDLDVSLPLRLSEDLHLKLKWRSLQTGESMSAILLKIVVKAAKEEAWEEAPEWCK